MVLVSEMKDGNLTGETAHQKLATLSSYSPRFTGNSLASTEMESSKLLRKGNQHNPNVAMTAKASFATLKILKER